MGGEHDEPQKDLRNNVPKSCQKQVPAKTKIPLGLASLPQTWPKLGDCWQTMVGLGPIWVEFGQYIAELWTSLGKDFGQCWPHWPDYGQIWQDVAEFGPIWTATEPVLGVVLAYF